MALRTIIFAIKNIYVNANPTKHHLMQTLQNIILTKGCKFQFHTISRIGDTRGFRGY